MQLRELPKEFRVRLRPSGTELKLGAMSDLLIHPQEDGRCWVYEAYRNELGLSGLNGLLLLYGPCTMEKALTFIDGYRAGRAKENRRDPAMEPF